MSPSQGPTVEEKSMVAGEKRGPQHPFSVAIGPERCCVWARVQGWPPRDTSARAALAAGPQKGECGRGAKLYAQALSTTF